jgi:phage gp36-like protein
MTYATQQDLIDRADAGEQTLIELTDRATPPTDAIDPVPVAKALADADAVCNMYLQAKYTLPLLSVPVVLRSIAADIALYSLYGNREASKVEERYKMAIKQLEQISKGQLSLGLDPANVPSVTTGGGAAYRAADRVFTPDTLAGYV